MKNRKTKRARMNREAKHKARKHNARRRHAQRAAYLREQEVIKASVVRVVNTSDLLVVDEV